MLPFVVLSSLRTRLEIASTGKLESSCSVLGRFSGHVERSRRPRVLTEVSEVHAAVTGRTPQATCDFQKLFFVSRTETSCQLVAYLRNTVQVNRENSLKTWRQRNGMTSQIRHNLCSVTPPRWCWRCSRFSNFVFVNYLSGAIPEGAAMQNGTDRPMHRPTSFHPTHVTSYSDVTPVQSRMPGAQLNRMTSVPSHPGE